MASLGAGTPLPDITTTTNTATTTPAFYTEHLAGLANQGDLAAKNAQYVGATGLQNQAFSNVANNVGNYQPALTAAQGLETSAGNADIGALTQQLMSPYTQDVVSKIGALGQANIANTLAPQATAGLVGTGQFGSQRGVGALGSVISNANLATQGQQASALELGYQQAANMAQSQIADRLASGQALNSLATNTQQMGLSDVNALSTLGGQQQAIEQNKELFPMQQLTSDAALLRGYSIPTSVSSTFKGPGTSGQYAPSPLSNIATIGSMIKGITDPATIKALTDASTSLGAYIKNNPTDTTGSTTDTTASGNVNSGTGSAYGDWMGTNAGQAAANQANTAPYIDPYTQQQMAWDPTTGMYVASSTASVGDTSITNPTIDVTQQ